MPPVKESNDLSQIRAFLKSSNLDPNCIMEFYASSADLVKAKKEKILKLAPDCKFFEKQEESFIHVLYLNAKIEGDSTLLKELVEGFTKSAFASSDANISKKSSFEPSLKLFPD